VGSATLNDVYGLDLTQGAESWHVINPGGTPPGNRCRHFAVHDDIADAMVIGFGYDYQGSYIMYNDVWALELTGMSWQQLFPSGIAVEGRRGAVAAFDSPHHCIFAFGGDHAYDYYLGDTYRLSLDPLEIYENSQHKARSFIRVFPNPFHGLCHIDAFVPYASPVSVKIVDVSGRMIRQMFAHPGCSGNIITEWDGKDNGGKTVPAGTYFIKLEINGMQSVQKTVVIE
jgi:hypothetical protein